MSEVKLLPLPDFAPETGHWAYTSAHMESYARANMEPLLQERDALRNRLEDTVRDLTDAKVENDRLRAENERLHAGKDGYITQHARDSRELRAVCAERDKLRGEVERLQRQLRQAHKDYGYELQDPNGTIWEHAAKQQARAERLRVDAERYRFIAGQHGLWWEEELDAAIERDRAAFDASLEQEGGNG